MPSSSSRRDTAPPSDAAPLFPPGGASDVLSQARASSLASRRALLHGAGYQSALLAPPLAFPGVPPEALPAALESLPAFVAEPQSEAELEAEAAGAPQESLAARTKSGAGWTAAGTVMAQALALGRNIVLAHLLSKGDYGVFGIAMLVTGALAMLTNMGISDSVIVQSFASRRDLETFLNTVWTAEVGRRTLMTLVLVALAYPMSRYYREPQLFGILAALSLTPFLSGLTTPGMLLLRRDVQFRRLFWFDLTMNALGTLVPIGVALVTRSVWALVWGQLAGALCGTLLSYAFARYRPRFAFDRAAFGKAFAFGKYTFVIGLMAYVTINADDSFVMRMLGKDVLGPYLIAYQIANLPGNALAGITSGLMFPVYAELAREGATERLERAVVRVFGVFSALMVLAFAPLAALAHDALLTVFGHKWVEAEGPLQVLTLVGMARGLLLMLSPLMMGMNKPQLEARSKVVEAVVFVSILGPMIHFFGTLGAAWSGVIVYGLACVLRFSFARRLLPGAFARVPRVVGGTLACGVGGALLARGWLLFLNVRGVHLPALRFGSGLVVCTAATLGLLLLLRPALRREAREVLLRRAA